MRRPRALLLLLAAILLPISLPQAATIWIEAEKPARSSVTRHPWWYDKVKVGELSGGGFISHWDKEKAGEADYSIDAQAGAYDLWVRANAVQAHLSYSLNDGAFVPLPLNSNEQSVNIAEDDKPDLRFVAWINAGKVMLRAGSNTLRFRFHSENNHHGILDCFVLASAPFQPRGKLKPGEIAARYSDEIAADKEWFSFAPSPDSFRDSPIDLRSLNEKFAGEHGFITTKGDEFVHASNQQPVRFWAVNGPPHSAGSNDLKVAARRLAKYGVNLVRAHGAVFDKRGAVDPKKVEHLQDVVAAMKVEGIYTLLSIYFPLWMQPAPDHPYLHGYDGKTHPFAALMFNEEFQANYRKWVAALLQTPGPVTGKRLIDDPALLAFEIQNEDSFFFWTFSPDRIPETQLKILEEQFGRWVTKKYGSIDAALAKWNKQGVKRDNAAEGRVSFRALYNMFSEKSVRDRDTVEFLFEVQQRFYADMVAYLRKLGFKGLVTASNWTTANPEVFGPLEKWSYATGDFIDRHGYFGGTHKGDNAAWSIRNGHTYADRSALRFDGSEPGKPRDFNHPVMDVTYAGKPSMISETTWTRPNRYRAEAPLYLATFGALQGSDSIVHFAFDGVNWSVKPGFWMQPWTLMAPSQIGQFPAAALIYRSGLVAAGATMASIRLNTNDLLNLKGTPLPQDASFDELRLKDVPATTQVKSGQRIDPLIHYVGKTEVTFSGDKSETTMKDLSSYIDRKQQVVRSSTKEVMLDYGKGLLLLNAEKVKAVSGDLKAGGSVKLKDVTFESSLDLAHFVLVSLDDAPLATSKRMLLQVMTEERNSGFTTEAAGPGLKKIVSIGRDPWQVKRISGSLQFNSPLKIQPLDLNGYPKGAATNAAKLKLQPETLYYLLTRD